MAVVFIRVLYLMLVVNANGGDWKLFISFQSLPSRVELLSGATNRGSTRTAKSLLRFRVASVDTVRSSQHRVCHLAEFIRAVSASHLRTAI
jgi:hypothetical protein